MARSKFRKGDQVVIQDSVPYRSVWGERAIVHAVRPRISPTGLKFADSGKGLVLDIVNPKLREVWPQKNGDLCWIWVYEEDVKKYEAPK